MAIYVVFVQGAPPELRPHVASSHHLKHEMCVNSEIIGFQFFFLPCPSTKRHILLFPLPFGYVFCAAFFLRNGGDCSDGKHASRAWICSCFSGDMWAAILGGMYLKELQSRESKVQARKRGALESSWRGRQSSTPRGRAV